MEINGAIVWIGIYLETICQHNFNRWILNSLSRSKYIRNFNPLVVANQNNPKTMTLAALYDIHGNLPALVAVLNELTKIKPDLVIIGGDVLLGPLPKQCIELLENCPFQVQYIKGNCDDAVLDHIDNKPPQNLPEKVIDDIRWTAQQLDNSQIESIRNWSKILNFELDPIGKILFCHATPRNNIEIFTKLTPTEKLLPVFEKTGADVVICGHTHMQFDINVGEARILNAGSVGMPFADPGAYWLLIDGSEIQLKQTEYDYKRAADLISKSNYPFAEDFAENNVLNPPMEALMLERFRNVPID